jgi:NitT/TauT family transport system ATP-binding protein
MARAIVFESIDLAFSGERILDQLSFAVSRGEFFCILGPSGCGKSTSLRLIGDLLAPDGGSVSVGGRPPAQAWHDIAFVFQSPRLAPWRNALANVLLSVELRYGRAAARERRQAAQALLSMVGLADAAGKFPLMLSGGERQRVAIARALAVDPEIILMDEPFAALDPNTRRRLRGEIEHIWQQTGKTIVFVTHDIAEAVGLADRLILLSNKPTRVLEEIRIDSPRPRDIDGNPKLRALRERLQTLFRSLEPAETEEA